MTGPQRFRVKQGTRLPALRLSLLQGDGTTPPGLLTACDFRMRSRRTAQVKVDAAAVIVDAPTMVVEYQWQNADVDTTGVYDAEFIATIDGKQAIFPAAKPLEDGALEVEVTGILT